MTKKERAQINYNPTNPSKLDEFGNIVPWAHEPVEKKGIGHYSRGDKEFLYLGAPPEVGGAARRVNISYSTIGPAIAQYFADMSERGKLPFDASKIKGIPVYEGEIPFMKKVGKTHEYGGVKVDTGNQEIILVDSRLSDSEKVATIFHELVHASGYDHPRGRIPTEKEVDAMERKTQLEAISGLRKMSSDFRDLIKRDAYEDNPNLNHSVMHMWEIDHPTIFKDAASYAIDARESFDVTLSDVKGRFEKDNLLEKKLATSSVLFIVLGSFFFSTKLTGNITGNVIGLSTQASSWIGLGLLFVGLVAGFFSMKKRK